LKAHLSEFIRRAEQGEAIVITSRGRPVAQLAPVAEDVTAEEAAIARFLALPFVTPGDGSRVEPMKPPIQIRPGQATLAELVSKGRE